MAKCAARGEAVLLDIDDYALNSQVLFPHPFPSPWH